MPFFINARCGPRNAIFRHITTLYKFNSIFYILVVKKKSELEIKILHDCVICQNRAIGKYS